MDGTDDDAIPYAKYLTGTSTKEVSTLDAVKERLGITETVSQNQIPQTTVIRILQIILIQQIIITAVTRIQMTMEMAVIMVLMMEMVEAQIMEMVETAVVETQIRITMAEI